MNDPIRGYAVAVAGTAAHRGLSGQLASELRALVAVLGAADELQWALTDSAVPVSGKCAIVEELLTGKIGDLAVRLVSFVVGVGKTTETISHLREVADFVEAAARVADGAETPAAFVLALPDELIGPPVGRQATRDRVFGYATAVFGLMHAEGRISEIEDELFRFARVVEGNRVLRQAMVDWNVPAAHRASTVVDLLGSKADVVSASLVAYALRAGNVGSIVSLLDWMVEMAAAERRGRVGEVRAAIQLSEEEIASLRRAMSRAVGRDVELRLVVDESVIGGAQVTVGELVVDGTVRRKLELARKSLIDAQ